MSLVGLRFPVRVLLCLKMVSSSPMLLGSAIISSNMALPLNFPLPSSLQTNKFLPCDQISTHAFLHQCLCDVLHLEHPHPCPCQNPNYKPSRLIKFSIFLRAVHKPSLTLQGAWIMLLLWCHVVLPYIVTTDNLNCPSSIVNCLRTRRCWLLFVVALGLCKVSCAVGVASNSSSASEDLFWRKWAPLKGQVWLSYMGFET